MPTTHTQHSHGLTDLSHSDARTKGEVVRKRPPKIALVVACSQRKCAPAPMELRLASIDAAPNARARQWRRRIQDVEAARHRAYDLYVGDHWRAACNAYRLTQQYSSRTELWIISAGYGLIASSKLIKPYSATFANGSVDSVWRGPVDGDRQACLQEWWQALPHDAALPELLRGAGTIVLAAGAPYLTALAGDLAAAIEQDRSGDRVSVLSAGSRGNIALLPVTGRFRAAAGGTDAALNARLLALLAAEAAVHRFRRPAMSAALDCMVPRLPMTQRRVGQSATDELLIDQIREIRHRIPGVSRTEALRELRQSGIACEQSRFASIWQRSGAVVT